MFVLLVTDVRTTGFDQRIFGPFETKEAAKAATTFMPIIRNRTTKVVRVMAPEFLTPADDYAEEG